MPSSLSWTTYERLTWLYPIVLALLISHELDAMIRNEWELLPGLSALSPEVAPDVFNLLHVPLFAGILWAGFNGSRAVRRAVAVGVEVFVVGHAVAHFALSGAARYLFEPPVETITVYGAALLAAVHLATLARPSA